MALYLSINGVDVTKYIVPTTQVVFDDKLNVSKTLSFSAYPADSSFPVVTANQRVRFYDDTRVIFTGYVTATPAKSNIITGYAGYKVVASSDEWPFNNTTITQDVTYVGLPAGTILQNLVNLAGGTGIDFSKVPQGPTVPQFVAQSGLSFSRAAQALSQKIGWRWYILDNVLYFVAQNDHQYGYDINSNDATFSLSNLNISKSNIPIVNDLYAKGNTEPTSYVNDNFVGDGNSTLFTLFTQPFGIGSSSVLFNDPFSSSTLSKNWTLTDPSSAVTYARKSVTMAGGTSAVGNTILFVKAPFELGGELTFDLGTFTFNQLSNGILSAIYSTNTFTQANCFAGVWATGNTITTGLQAIVNGTPQNTTLVTQSNHAYQLLTHVSVDTIYRYRDIFRSITGQFGGDIIKSDGYVTVEILDHDLSNPTAQPTSTILYDSRVTNIPAFGYIGMFNCLNLFATVTNGPKVTQLDPVRVRDSNGRVSKWTANQFDNNTWKISLGTPPVLNDAIFVHYRAVGNVTAHVQNGNNVAVNGLKTATISLPANVRSSADCENLFQAFLMDHANSIYEGAYVLNSATFGEIPTSGRYINITVPSISAQAFVSVVREASVAFTDLTNEVFNLTTTFGFAALMNSYSVTLNQTGFTAASDINSFPFYLDDDTGFQTPTITGLAINADGGRTPVSKFQVRTDDLNWGISSGTDFVGDFLTQTFALTRTSRSNVFYVREVNGSKFSRNSSILLATGYPITPAAPLNTSSIAVGLNVTYTINLGSLTDLDSVQIYGPDGTTQVFTQKADTVTLNSQTIPQIVFTRSNVDYLGVVNQRTYTNYQFYTLNFRGEKSTATLVSGSLPVPAAPTITVSTVDGETATFLVSTETRTDITEEILEVATDTAFSNIVAIDDEDQQFGTSTVDVPAIGTYYVRARKSDVLGFGSNTAQSQNWLVESEQLDNASWVKLGGTTVTADNVANPINGLSTADTINFATKTINTVDGLRQNTGIILTPGTYTFSLWMKVATGTQVVELIIEDSGGNSIFGVGTRPTVTTIWQRFSISGTYTGTPSNPTNLTLQVWIRAPFGQALSAYSVQAFGTQLEPSATVNSYLPTTTTAITVAQPQSFVVTTISSVDKNTPNVPSALTAPTQAIVKSADGTLVENVTLSWTAPTTPPAVTGYVIRYKVSTGTVYTYNRVGLVTTATIHGLLLNTTYNISVASVGEVNQQSAFLTDINVTTNNNTTAPSTVSGLAATGAFREVDLTWTAVTDSDLAFYQIDWAPDISGVPGTFQTIAKANTNHFTDRGDSSRGQLAVSTTYWYRVSAFNTTGVQGGLSSNLSATTTTVGMDSDISDGSTYGRPLISRLNAGRPLIDFSEAIHLNKILDNIGDGSTYARVIASDMTTNRIDFSKSLLNKHLGNVPDDSTSGRYAGLQAGSNGDGFQILSNPDFTGGSLSGYTVYDNAASGKVTHTAVQDATTPNSSGWNLQISTASGTPAPSPGLGGFFRGIGPDSGQFAVNTYHKGSTIIWRIRANIPVGFTINQATNATGAGGTFTWLTSQSGIGAYFEYVAKQVIGTAGTFSTTAFYYLAGTAPVTWNVAMCSAVCISHPAGFGVADIDVNRRANIDFTQTSHIGKHLGNIPDDNASSRFAVLAIDANRRPFIDFSQASHLNKILDNIGDGTTFKRVLNVNADNTFHISTSLNSQASVLPNQALLITYQVPSTSQIFGSWLAQSLTRPDQSIINITSSQGTNKVVNGDFETGTVGSAPPSWNVLTGGTCVTDNVNVHGGSKDCKLSVSANTLFVQQAVSVTSGVIYCIEGWIAVNPLVVISGQGAFIQINTSTGVSAIGLLAKTSNSGGASDNSTQFQIGFAADNTSHGMTFFQAYFQPTGTGNCIVNLVLSTSSSGVNAWFDDVKVYQHNGIYYSGLGAGNSYYIYPRVSVSGNTGTINFVNSNPPSQNPSDALAISTGFDGNIPVGVTKIGMPTSGSGGSLSGGGVGSCPEFNELVFIRRYDDNGKLIFDGQIRVGDVRTGREPDDGGPLTGDFLKGYSFTKKQDVYRAVQLYQHLPCGGWVIINGHKLTVCESVYWDGQWMPAWKVPGAVHISHTGLKVQIQIEADWDDEHNYYVGDLLIHNFIAAS